MESLKNRTLTNVIPPDHIDYTLLWQFVIATCGIVSTVIYTVNKYFANKAKEKEEFIANVVKATIESSLLEYKNEFKDFKKEMSGEVAHFNRTVIEIYSEIRKP
jgi:hypothetical protein